MMRNKRNRWIGAALGVLVAFALAPEAGKAGPCFRCRVQPVNMPVSLAVGTVRTTPFFVKDADYKIRIRVKRGLPLVRLECMMGIRVGDDHDHCAVIHVNSVIGASWTVWDGDTAVAVGKAGEKTYPGYSDDTIDRSIGLFAGKPNKKYVLEVKFTMDGSVLDEFQPRLIVQELGY